MAKLLWKVLSITNMIVGCITTIYGFFMFFWFYFGHQNYNNAIWGLVTSINAFVMTHLLVLKSAEKISVYSETTMKCLRFYGISFTVATFAAIPTYVYLGLQRHQRFDLQSLFTAACLALVSMKGSFTTSLIARNVLEELKGRENIFTSPIIRQDEEKSEDPEAQNSPFQPSTQDQGNDNASDPQIDPKNP